MAQINTTFSTYDAAGLREQLSNIIYNIDPTDRPFMAAVGRDSVKGKIEEWQLDTLAAAITTNAVIEGDDITTYPTLVATVRVKNYVQTSEKKLLISDDEEIVEKAGRGSEIDYQVAKKGQELFNDVEATLSGNIGSLAGDDTTARLTGTFEAWITSNDSRNTGGADGGYNSGTGLVVAATDDTTTRALTEEMFQATLQLCWENGGKPTLVICRGNHKRQISKFNNATAGGTATVTRFDDNDDMKLVTAIDVYRHDFGTVRIEPSRFSRARSILIVDPSMWSIGWFRPVEVVELAKTGHAEKRMLRCAYVLISKNQKSSGVIADLT